MTQGCPEGTIWPMRQSIIKSQAFPESTDREPKAPLGLRERMTILRHLSSPPLSQEEASDKVGVTRAAWANWEQEGRCPRWEALIRIADKFDVTVDWLLGRGKGTLLSVVRDKIEEAEARLSTGNIASSYEKKKYQEPKV
ncbi:hypothetical protein CCP1ISM_5750001 [Azospirillaceae bacterium]